MDEREAVEQLKRGNLTGLAYLVRCHQVRAVRAAYLIVREEGLAAEIVQQSFLAAYDHIDQFDPDRPFAPWFLRIVTNQALKTAQQMERLVELNEDAPDDSPHQPPPETHLEAAERRRILWLALGRISAEDRQAIVLRYFLEQSEAEMALALGVAPGTVKWRLHEARRRLKRWLLQLGGGAFGEG